jgi:hypothetical protein
LNRTERTGLPGHDSCVRRAVDKDAGAGQLEKDNLDRKVGTGRLRQDIRDRTTGTGQPRQVG